MSKCGFIVTVGKRFGKSFYFGDSSYIIEVESRTQSLRPRTQKKSKTKAKDRLLEDRPFRGQGQECSRSTTKDTTRIGLDPGFLIGGVGKPQITCNDVIRNFQKRNFLWDKDIVE